MERSFVEVYFSSNVIDDIIREWTPGIHKEISDGFTHMYDGEILLGGGEVMAGISRTGPVIIMVCVTKKVNFVTFKVFKRNLKDWEKEEMDKIDLKNFERTNDCIESLVGKIMGYLEYKLSNTIAEGWKMLGRELQYNYYDLFGKAESQHQADPIVLDLDGDGFETTSIDDGVYFDNNNRGMKEQTAWVGADDGLLAVDLNGDGTINSGAELFGDSTVFSDGTTGHSGLEALSQYDSNGDGVIDAQDEMFNNLLVWQDKNQNGISEEDELKSLAELGIESISLNASELDGVNSVDVNYSDGHSNKAGEFNFDAIHFNAVDKEDIEISEEIQALPNVQAFGDVASLHTLMQLDESGTLKGYVEQFVNAQTIEEREELTTTILYYITGADKVDKNSRGVAGNMYCNADAQQLTVLEAFLGRDYHGQNDRNDPSRPLNMAVPYLEKAYETLFDYYYTLLSMQTNLKPYMKMVFVEQKNDGRLMINTSLFDSVMEIMREEDTYEEKYHDVIADMGRLVCIYNINNRDNFIQYALNYSDDPQLFERIKSVASRDITFGTDGDDEIQGNTYWHGDAHNYTPEDDYIYAGKGNDTISGGCGRDTYVFNLGDGQDIINNVDRNNWMNDRIIFGEGINPEDLIVRREDKDLIIENKTNDDKITLRYAFTGSVSLVDYFIGSVIFADGTVWNKDVLVEKARYINGTNDVETIKGYDYGFPYNRSEIIDGKDGDDVIYGGYGSDIIIGGKGNDTLYGERGEDTYVFSLGDGQDIIKNSDGSNWRRDKIAFTEGISPEDIEVKREGNNMVITNKNSDDMITVKDAFASNDYGYDYVGTIVFADGTVWGNDVLAEKTRYYEGTKEDDTIEGHDIGWNYNRSEVIDGKDGDDVIKGNAGDDVIIGGTGNDTLTGGSGADTYVFNLGDGQDVINNYDSQDATRDKIVFAEGIAAEDIIVERDDKDLILRNKNNDDKITVKDAFYDNLFVRYIGQVEFSDGTVWDKDVLKEKTRYITGSEIADTLEGKDKGYNYNTSEIIDGGAGDDKIKGNAGDDVIIGGTGNDNLTGGRGADTYVFNLGDGQDTIDNYDVVNWREDKIVFGEGVSAGDIIVFRNAYDLVISNKTNDDKITVKNAFSHDNGYYYVPRIEFADKTVWDRDVLAEKTRHINGTAGDDKLDGYATAFNYSASEIIDGGAGNDTINGNAGDDTIIGGTGNDVLAGNGGADTYVFNLGDGQDTISNYDSSNWMDDKIVFGDGIAPEDIVVKRDGDNLIFKNKNNDDSIKLLGAFSTSNKTQFIGSVEFADGTVWNEEKIIDLVRHISGTDGKDTIKGYDTGSHYNISEIIDGGEGDDTINGNAGDDFIIGGKGNDVLAGNSGADTYVFNLGDGQDSINNYDITDAAKDKIVFGEGISPDDIIVDRKNNNLVFINKNTNDIVTVNSAFNAETDYSYIGIVEFADGTVWTKAELKEKSRIHYGTDGNDTIKGSAKAYNYNTSEEFYGGAGNDVIYGNEGDDVIEGGAGNDTLYGGRGADTYIFNIGDGQDIIYNDDNKEGGASDKIVFGEGINPDDIVISRKGDDLVIANKTNTDTITVKDAFSYDDYSRFITTIQFADKTVWDESDIIDKARCINGTSGNETIRGFDNGYHYDKSEIIDGKEGDDIIVGNKGNDYIIGGKGNDTLQGDEGSDVYYFEGNFGTDTIIDPIGFNTILFGKGIKPGMVHSEVSGNDLIIHVAHVNESAENVVPVNADEIVGEIVYEVVNNNNTGANKIIIKNYFVNDNASGFVIRYEDDKSEKEYSLYYAPSIIEIDDSLGSKHIDGTIDADSLSGREAGYKYIIRGFDGDDYLYGNSYADTLWGGTVTTICMDMTEMIHSRVMMTMTFYMVATAKINLWVMMATIHLRVATVMTTYMVATVRTFLKVMMVMITCMAKMGMINSTVVMATICLKAVMAMITLKGDVEPIHTSLS